VAVRLHLAVRCAHSCIVGNFSGTLPAPQKSANPTPLREKACVQLPFSVYFAWITVATAADIAAAASYAGWFKWVPSDAVWGILAAAIVLIFTLVVIAMRRDIAFGLVAVWALVGIAVKQSATLNIAYTTEIGSVIVAAALVVAILRSKMKTSK
jgi:hypothetical protein